MTKFIRRDILQNGYLYLIFYKMKKIVFVLLCTVLAFGVRANASQTVNPDDQKVKVAAVSVTSDKPGQDGVKILKDFSAGDDANLVTRNSSLRMRRQAVKMAAELYRVQELTYAEYAQLAEDLGIKPKSQAKLDK